MDCGGFNYQVGSTGYPNSFHVKSLEIPPNLLTYPNQVDGHGALGNKPAFLFSETGNIVYKPVQKFPKGLHEVSLYQQVFDASCTGIIVELRKFIPTYIGVFHEVGTQRLFIGMKDLLSSFEQPTVCDIKLGRRTYTPDSGPEKVETELRKYLWQDQLGFSINAMKVWDADLAIKAQKWADTCALGLDAYLNRSLPKWSWVGQNWVAAPSIKAAFDQWRKGHEMYNFTGKSCFGNSCGEYTQIVWAGTIAVGCGIKNCTTMKNFPNTFSIACNYGPGGNIAGQSPYVVGTMKDCIAPVAKGVASKLIVQRNDSFGVKWSLIYVLLIICQLLYFVLLTSVFS